MKLFWTHLWKSASYRRATAQERRLIEIRYSVGRALCAKRRALRVTQAELGARIGAAQSTISKLERGSGRAALDILVRALIALDCGDDEIATAFNAAARPDIRRLRTRAAERFFPLPAGAVPVIVPHELIGRHQRSSQGRLR